MLRKSFLLLGLTFLLLLNSLSARGAEVTTADLIIRDGTATLPPATFDRLVKKVEFTFAEVRRFWSADTRTQEWGRILVELDNPLTQVSSSVFLWGKDKGKKMRIVKVYGGGESPHLLAHKLTSALFPNPDKLIRNMMGEASEIRFGNPLSFPSCGFSTDEWVLALKETGTFIPLSSIGPKHEDWGMEMENGVPKVQDRAKQHACYVEAGSFGEYLVQTYGSNALKQLNQRSSTSPRPWQSVFGKPLDRLETDWLDALKAKTQAKRDRVSLLAALVRKNPATACSVAQDRATAN